jgi:hypothetical protein
MKKKLAILCAYPATRNTGMITVDLAVHAVLERHLKDVECTFYTYGDLASLKTENLGMPIEYRHILHDKEQFLNSDAYLFWGDFIHAKSYQIDLRYRKSPEKDIQDLLELSFLKDVDDERLEKAVVFGGTIITNEAADDADKNYGGLFDRFFKKCGAVLFRDALSAAKVSRLRGNEATFGCDCALLLHDKDLEKIEGTQLQPKDKREGIGFFLSRSPAKIQSCLFARYLSKKLGKKVTWLNWLPVSKKMQMVGKLFGFDIYDKSPTPGEILTELSGYEFIVSDTYHRCINAWRLGIPAICIGEGAGHLKTTLNDKKKEILFEMYGGRQFYVFTEHLKTLVGFPHIANRVEEVLNNQTLIDQFRDNLNKNIVMAEGRLKDALDKALK